MNVTRLCRHTSSSLLRSVHRRNILTLQQHFCTQSETEINGDEEYEGGLAESLHVDHKLKKLQMRAPVYHNKRRIRPNLRDAATKIQQCSNIDQIQQIIDAHIGELDLYRMAIVQGGVLKQINFCISIMDLMREQNITPNVWIFNELFKALAENNRAYMMPSFARIMLGEYNIIPNRRTVFSLLYGCGAEGNTKFAEWILKKVAVPYGLQLELHQYIQLIKIYGKAGKLKKCEKIKQQMIEKGFEINARLYNTLIAAYTKSGKIRKALKIKEEIESKGGHLGIEGYSALFGFYLKNTKHLNPQRSLELLEEGYRVNNLMTYDLLTMEMKFVAHLKLLEMNPTSKELFEKITVHLPDEAEKNGMRGWNFGTAGVCFRAHLVYYNQDYDNENVVKCFEKFEGMKCLGYWSDDDDKGHKKIVDLHGYSYEEIKFIIHYLFKYKVDDLVNQMGYEWKMICGKQKGVDPHVKAIGIKEFVMNILRDNYAIRCEVDPTNSGRVILCEGDVRHYVERSMQQNEEIDFSQFTVAELKEKCKQNGLKVSGRKSELIDRLKDSISEFTVAQLKVKCKQNGLKVSRKIDKSELVDRLTIIAPSNETRGGALAHKLKTL